MEEGRRRGGEEEERRRGEGEEERRGRRRRGRGEGEICGTSTKGSDFSACTHVESNGYGFQK